MSSIASASVHSNVPTYALFDSNAVAAATFLGTPVAGASLMALNYRRLGFGIKAMNTLLVGIAVSALVVLLAWNLPRTVVSPIALVLLFGTRGIAERLQGRAVKAQVERGGRLGSRWAAFGLGAAFLAAVFGVIYVAEVAADNTTKIVIGSKDEVFYAGSATKEEALALGNALKRSGYLTDRGVSVFLAKEQNSKVLSFVIKDGSWNQPSLVSLFEELGRKAAPSIGGLPVQVRMINNTREVKEESTVGKAAFNGEDVVYYLGTATESDAQALGKDLKSHGFFQGKGYDVFLSKHKDGVVLSFVVRDGAWENPALVGTFEKTVRETAAAVGGLPLRLRLLNTSLEVKKEEWIR
jgi:hypothetical protein